jgi:uncharacterized protein YecT (DUF1311 family)
MDGDILRVSKEFGAKDGRITAQISCKMATEELSVTLKGHDSDMQPRQLASHLDDKGDRFPTGRLKSKNTSPMPLDYWFMMDGSDDSATWLISTKGDDTVSQVTLAAFGLQRAMVVKALGGYDYDAHPYGMPMEGSFFYFNLPWVIELSSEGGPIEIEIPAGDTSIDALASACKANKMPRKDPEFFIDQVGTMAERDVDVIEARLQEFHKSHPKINLVVTTATDRPEYDYTGVANALISNSTFSDSAVERSGTNMGNVVLFIDPPNHRATVVTTKQVWSGINLPVLVNEAVITRVTNQASTDFSTQSIAKVIDGAVSTLITAIDVGETPHASAAQGAPADNQPTGDAARGGDVANNAVAATTAVAPTAAASISISPSFDCSKAVSSVEKMICTDAALASADAALAATYSKAKTSSTDGWLRSSQREFLQVRNACGTSACVAGTYHARQAELDARLPHP